MDRSHTPSPYSAAVVSRGGGGLLELCRGAGLRQLLQHEDVPAVLLETHRVGLDITQDPVEVLLVDAQEEAAVLAAHDCRRSAGRGSNKNSATRSDSDSASDCMTLI